MQNKLLIRGKAVDVKFTTLKSQPFIQELGEAEISLSLEDLAKQLSNDELKELQRFYLHRILNQCKEPTRSKPKLEKDHICFDDGNGVCGICNQEPKSAEECKQHDNEHYYPDCSKLINRDIEPVKVKNLPVLKDFGDVASVISQILEKQAEIVDAINEIRSHNRLVEKGGV